MPSLGSYCASTDSVSGDFADGIEPRAKYCARKSKLEDGKQPNLVLLVKLFFLVAVGEREGGAAGTNGRLLLCGRYIMR